MNRQNELLVQFVLESRECLEQIGQRLLDVERDPKNGELLNDLFRLVHTLKGNSGLFDFKPLERVVHAGEDLLDRVRHGDIDYSADIADALFDAMDYTALLVESIESDGQLPADAESRSSALSAKLREQLAAHAAGLHAAPAQAAANGPAAPAEAAVPPAWLSRLGSVPADGVAVRYRPEPECFFKGEDPWYLVTNAPGLRGVDVAPVVPWAESDDCYRCNLDIVALCDAPLAYVTEHFRYVPEQVDLLDLSTLAPPPAAVPATRPAAAPSATGAAAGTAVLMTRLTELWSEQVALLAQPGVTVGSVDAARLAMDRLLTLCGGDTAATARRDFDALGHDRAALLQWAADFVPGAASSETTGGAASVPGPAAERLQPVPRSAAASRTGGPAEEGERGHRVLKVAQDKIDRLMELIGEMVVAKNALPYLAARAESVFQQRELAREIKTQYSVINRIAEDMQHAIMQVRMLPVGTVFQRFSRLVRDISKKLGKEVTLIVEGEDTEADKNVIESLADPLIHILRNSLDHGIELPAVRLAAGKPAAGTLRVSARQEGDRVILDIADDGGGIDPARVRAKAVDRGLIPADRADALSDHESVQLVFLPGFSTAETVSDLSGRGVGMDVVRSAVDRVNGTVELSSVLGQGTTIRLSLPLSMAVTNVMKIEAGGRRFGVPMDLIVETVRVPAEDIHSFKQARTVVLRGRIVPLMALSDLLALDTPPRLNADGEHAVLVVRLSGETIGLLVDDFDGTSDIILKPLEGVLTGMTGFAGTALMGDGSVLMILNPKELV